MKLLTRSYQLLMPDLLQIWKEVLVNGASWPAFCHAKDCWLRETIWVIVSHCVKKNDCQDWFWCKLQLNFTGLYVDVSLRWEFLKHKNKNTSYYSIPKLLLTKYLWSSKGHKAPPSHGEACWANFKGSALQVTERFGLNALGWGLSIHPSFV